MPDTPENDAPDTMPLLLREHEQHHAPGIIDHPNPVGDGCPGLVKYGVHRGGQCGNPVSEAEEADGIHCFAHQSQEFKRARGFGGPIPGAGRKKRPDRAAAEVLRAEIERQAIERATEIVNSYFDALDAETTVTIRLGSGKDAEVEIVHEPDHATRMRASDAILDRVIGKPVQQVDQRSIALNVNASSEEELVSLLETMAAARLQAPAE